MAKSLYIAFVWGLLFGAGIFAMIWKGHEYTNPCVSRIETSSWTVPAEGNCEVFMPHAKIRCGYGLIRGGEIEMEGY